MLVLSFGEEQAEKVEGLYRGDLLRHPRYVPIIYLDCGEEKDVGSQLREFALDKSPTVCFPDERGTIGPKIM